MHRRKYSFVVETCDSITSEQCLTAFLCLLAMSFGICGREATSSLEASAIQMKNNIQVFEMVQIRGPVVFSGPMFSASFSNTSLKTVFP